MESKKRQSSMFGSTFPSLNRACTEAPMTEMCEGRSAYPQEEISMGFHTSKEKISLIPLLMHDISDEQLPKI